MTKKKKLALIAVLSLSVACVVCIASISLDSWIRNRPPEAKRIKSMDEPDLVVYWFHQSLIEDNITLAKEYMTAENRERLDDWQRNTQRRDYGCESDWGWFLKYPFEIQRISWGGMSSVEIDDNTIEETSTLGCYNNHYSMEINKIIVKRIENEWVITDWDRICEKLPSDNPDDSTKTCYP